MGQYFEIINVDKRQVICPHNYDNGLKLMEWAYDKNAVVMAMVNLMADAWKGDRVYVVGDYADNEDENEIWVSTYNEILTELHRPGDSKTCFEWEDFAHIMPDANLQNWQHRTVLTAEDKADITDYEYRYFYNHATKQVVDLEKCPVVWTYTDRKTGQEVPVRISPLALLLAMGNGRGGGDYRGPHLELLGSWCATVQNIEITQEPIDACANYEDFCPDFWEDI